MRYLVEHESHSLPSEHTCFLHQVIQSAFIKHHLLRIKNATRFLTERNHTVLQHKGKIKIISEL